MFPGRKVVAATIPLWLPSSRPAKISEQLYELRPVYRRLAGLANKVFEEYPNQVNWTAQRLELNPDVRDRIFGHAELMTSIDRGVRGRPWPLTHVKVTRAEVLLSPRGSGFFTMAIDWRPGSEKPNPGPAPKLEDLLMWLDAVRHVNVSLRYIAWRLSRPDEAQLSIAAPALSAEQPVRSTAHFGCARSSTRCE